MPATQRPTLVARIRPVHRKGTTYTQRRWVRPEEQPALLDSVPLHVPDRFTPSAGEAYKLLGVHAPAFKAWFGDWEKPGAPCSRVTGPDGAPQAQEPVASAVVDNTGQPVVVYHGSPAKFREFSPAMQDEGSNYGGGFYFTSDLSVADGAGEEPQPTQANTTDQLGYRRARVALTGIDRDALCDSITGYLQSSELAPEVKAQALELLMVWRTLPMVGLGEAVDMFSGPPYNLPVFQMAKSLGLDQRGHTYAVYLNIRRPLDLSDPDALQAFARQACPGEHVEDAEDLADALGGEVTEAARSLGYDGLTMVQWADNRPHRCWVAFEPGQIKSVDNQGEFSSHSRDIFKALPPLDEIHDTTLPPRVQQVQEALEARLQDIRVSYQAAVNLYDAAKPVLGQKADEYLNDIRGVHYRQAANAIRLAYQELCNLGRAAAGVTGPLSKDEALQLKKLYIEELQFFKNLLLDIEHHTGKMSYRRRVALYGNGARESYWLGYILADQRPGRYVQWVRNKAKENCSHCALLARGGLWGTGIYTAKALAKAGLFPQSGKLLCITLCGCGLRQVPKPTEAPLAASDPRRLTLEQISHIIDQHQNKSSFHGNGRTGREALEKRAQRHGNWSHKGRKVRPGPVKGKRRPILKALISEEMLHRLMLDRFLKPGSGTTQYDYASTQVNLEERQSQEVLSWCVNHIPAAVLAEKGIEKDSHITVKYGINDPDGAAADVLAEALSATAPVVATLGPLGVFRSNPKYDVLYVSVASPGLVELNQLIAQLVPCTDTHPDYKPHLTLAYVQKGAADEFESREDFAGQTLGFDYVVFSDRHGQQPLPLGL